MLLTAIKLAEDPESLAAAHANLGAVFEAGGRKEEVGGHVLTSVFVECFELMPFRHRERLRWSME